MCDSCKVYTVGNYDVQENGIVRDNTNGGVIVGRLDELATGRHWEETARQYAINEEFYRNLVIEIGEPFGIEAKTSDDGSIQEDVLAIKVPELVDSLRQEVLKIYKSMSFAICAAFHHEEITRSKARELHRFNSIQEFNAVYAKWLQSKGE